MSTRPECANHSQPLDIVEVPDTREGRSGWLQGNCRKCGKLLGYRLPVQETQNAKRKASAGALDVKQGEASLYYE